MSHIPGLLTGKHGGVSVLELWSFAVFGIIVNSAAGADGLASI